MFWWCSGSQLDCFKQKVTENCLWTEKGSKTCLLLKNLCSISKFLGLITNEAVIGLRRQSFHVQWVAMYVTCTTELFHQCPLQHNWLHNCSTKDCCTMLWLKKWIFVPQLYWRNHKSGCMNICRDCIILNVSGYVTTNQRDIWGGCHQQLVNTTECIQNFNRVTKRT